MIIDDRILMGLVVLAALSTFYFAWDNLVRKKPDKRVIKCGWVLISL